MDEIGPGKPIRKMPLGRSWSQQHLAQRSEMALHRNGRQVWLPLQQSLVSGRFGGAEKGCDDPHLVAHANQPVGQLEGRPGVAGE
ncbi:MAG TPA: hypothetical protein VI410_11185 [Anaerolineales bacterium]|nr:hypothetical protein [Anaerolineales bacterium]